MKYILNYPSYHLRFLLSCEMKFNKFFISAILLFLLFLNTNLEAQSVNLVATTSGQSNGTSLTFTHNRGTDANTVTLVSVQLGRQTEISGNVTYGGNNMTLVGQSWDESGSGRRATVYIYSILNPPTGNQNIVINVSGSNRIIAGASSFSNVNPSTPLRAYTGSNGSATGDYFTANLTNVATGPGEIVFSAISYSNGSTNPTFGSGQTQRWSLKTSTSDDDLAKGAGSTKEIASGSTTSISYGNLDDSWWGAGAVSVRPNPCNLNATVSRANANCFGTANGSITVSSPTGGSGNYQYRLDTGTWQSSGSFTGLAAGTYSVQMRDANNTTCTQALGNQTITQPAQLNATVNSANATCFGTSNGSITVSSPSGGSGSYQYRLDAGTWQSSGSFTGLVAGTYSVQIRDANNTTCVVVLGNQVINQPGALSAPVFKSNVTCFGQNNGTITLGPPSGGSGSYQYRLNIGSWQSSNSFTGLAPGSYLVQIRDANNTSCEVSLGIENVTQPAALISNGVTSNVSCNGGNNGAIVQTVSGGTSPYSYVWSDGGPTTKDRSMLTAGMYTVTITDNNSCVITRTYNIIQSTTLTLTADVTPPQCASSGSINLTVSGGSSPYNFDWADLPGTNDPQNRSNISVNGGNFSVTVTDQSGCSATGFYPLPAINCGPGQIVCIEGNNAAVYSVTPDPFVTSYNWTVSNGGVIVSGQGTPEVVVDWTGATAGTGQICVSTENDCGESAQTCKNIILRLVDAFADVNQPCTGGNIELSAEGGVSYQWSGPGGFTSNLQNPIIYNASGSNNGTYVVTVTDDSGCSATASVAVTVSVGFTLSADVFTSACGQNIGAVDITVTGGTSPFVYLWSNGETSQDITDLPGGNYMVTVTDANLCTGMISGSVGDLDGPTLTASSTNVTCNGGNNGSVSIVVSGGSPPVNFLWSNGATTQNISGLTAGIYNVVAIDAFGCVGAATGFVNQPNPFQVNISRTNLSCFGSNNGSITLNVTGGTPGYTYNWSDIGSGSSSRTGLAAGAYSVTISDALSCTTTRLILITQPTAITGSVVTENVVCFGQQNGIVKLTVSGGTLPYTYNWQGPSGFTATTKDINGLIAGTYNVTVTDARGCTFTQSGTVNQPAVISLSDTKTNVLCNSGLTGSINLTVSGGNGGYLYQWSNGQTTEDISDLGAGTYTVLVTDNKACTATRSITITEPTMINVTSLVNDVACFGTSTGSVNVNVTGGTGTYSFVWSDGGPMDFFQK
jgi:large repetitive protein